MCVCVCVCVCVRACVLHLAFVGMCVKDASDRLICARERAPQITRHTCVTIERSVYRKCWTRKALLNKASTYCVSRRNFILTNKLSLICSTRIACKQCALVTVFNKLKLIKQSDLTDFLTCACHLFCGVCSLPVSLDTLTFCVNT